MKFLFCAIVALACSSAVSAASNYGKVKLTNASFAYVNEDYFNASMSVANLNSTYSRLVTEFHILKDLPMDTQVIVRIQESTKGCGQYKTIGTYSLSLCNHDNDKYEKYLPPNLLKVKRGGKCFQKGYYHSPNGGYFAFYDLMTEEELSHKCFKVFTTVKSPTELFYVADLDFVSNVAPRTN